MKGKLSTLGFVLILSAFIFSGCAPSTARPIEPPTATGGEYCLDSDTGAKLSYQEAVEIAQNSECLEQGQLKGTRFCNEDTGTWWIDLDIDKPGCMPACVVHVSDKTTEINWRCTGVLPPEGTVEAPDPVRARDAALAYLSERYGEQAPAPGLAWTEERTTPEGLVGSSTFQYTAEDWMVTVSFPLVAPEATIYQVVVANQTTGFQWEGEVDARGQVMEQPTEARINVVEQAGLGRTIEIEILKLDPNSPSAYLHLGNITAPEVIAQIIAALDVDLQLCPRARRLAQYTLRFLLDDGTVQEFGYTYDPENPSFMRGGQGFWQGQDAEPPAEFDKLLQEQLTSTPLPTGG